MREQRTAGRSRGPARAARPLAQAQDRRLQGAGGGGRHAGPPGDRARSSTKRSPRAGPGGGLHLGRGVGARRAGARRGQGQGAAASTVLAGDVVPAKKPDPAIYRLALERTGADPADDARHRGLPQRPARCCGGGPALRGHREHYTVDEDFSEAVLVVSSLGDAGGACPRSSRTTARPSPAGTSRWTTCRRACRSLPPRR